MADEPKIVTRANHRVSVISKSYRMIQDAIDVEGRDSCSGDPVKLTFDRTNATLLYEQLGRALNMGETK